MNAQYYNDGWKRLQSSYAVFLLGIAVLLATTCTAEAQNNNYPVNETTFAQLASSQDNSENNLLSIQFVNTTIQEALELLAEETNVGFSYNPDVIPNKRVSFSMSNVPPHEVIYKLLEGTNLEPVLPSTKDVIVIREKEHLPAVDAFQYTITGTVVDAQSGEALPGVNVVAQRPAEDSGSPIGTTTDLNGQYELEVPDNVNTLAFTYVGFQRLEVAIEGRSEINVEMVADVYMADELVVVGYGSQRKINLTGAIDVTSSDKLENRGLVNTASALQGVSSNLNIQATNRGGEPGASQDINIRGIGTLTGDGGKPYILVDGMPMDINQLDPNNIEEVTVLKDAAASAIYGSRAAYGVILIETKKGQENQPISVQLSTSINFKRPAILPHNASSIEFAQKRNFSFENAGSNPPIDDEYFNRIRAYANGEFPDEIYIPDEANGSLIHPGVRHVANNDWPYLTFGNWAPQQKYNLSVSGGGDKSTYYISAGHSRVDGVMTFGDEYYENNQVVANFSTSLQDWFTLKLNTNYSFRHNQRGVAKNERDREDFWKRHMQHPATTALYAPNGMPIQQEITDMIQLSDNDVTETNDLWVKLSGELNPFEGFRTEISYSRNFIEERRSIHRATTFTPIHLDGTTRTNQYQNPSYEVDMGEDTYYIFNIVSTYQESLADHNFEILAGYEEEFTQERGLFGRRNGLLSAEVPSISLAIGQDARVQDSWETWATQGIFSRFNYNFREKYLLEINARYDGSSRFQNAGDKWGLFPSIALGYNISQEPFWESSEALSFITNLKFRGSYGSLGNQNVPNYTFLPLIPINPQVDYIFGDERPPNALPPGLISRSLTWETVNNINIGVDAAFFNNRLEVTFDWFKRSTVNMFGPAESLPAVLGTEPSVRNNAELSTTGFDMKVVWRDVINNDMNYSVEFMLGDNISKVVKYNNPTNFLGEGTWYEGQKVGEIWGYETVGFFKDQADVEQHADQSEIFSRWSAGDIKFKDLDGDGVISRGDFTLDNPGDLKVIGNSQPRYQFGAIGTVNYKGIDFRLFLQGTLKRDVFIQDDSFFGHRHGGPFWEEHTDYWTPEGSGFGGGPNAYFPKRYEDSSEDDKNLQPQSKYVQDASYVRVKEVQLGYTIPYEFTKNFNIDNARIYVVGNNILTFTNLRIFDPENIQTNGFYPVNKFYGAGLNITF